LKVFIGGFAISVIILSGFRQQEDQDERALDVSWYVFCGKVKYTEYAYNKVVEYKRRTKTHLMDQIERFRMGDKDGKRENDLLDTFCYGIALSLGNSEGF
jgi:hypothetical protein